MPLLCGEFAVGLERVCECQNAGGDGTDRMPLASSGQSSLRMPRANRRQAALETFFRAPPVTPVVLPVLRRAPWSRLLCGETVVALEAPASFLSSLLHEG